MFGRKRTKPSEIAVKEVENFLGVLLTNRPSIINYGDISKTNIFAGTVISRAFNRDQKKLSDEFDFIVMFFGRELLHEKGIGADVIEAAQEAMFKNLIDPNDQDAARYLATYSNRLQNYAEAVNMNDVAIRLLKNVAVEPLNDREAQSSELFAKQLSAVKKFMSKGLDGELKAASVGQQ